MPVPVFEQPIKKETSGRILPAKEKLSGWVMFFSATLIVMLVFTIELGLKDVNRVYNDQYDACWRSSNVYTFFQDVKPRKGCDIAIYEGNRLTLHAEVLLPIILISGIILLILRKKKLSSYFRVIKIAYSFFILWLVVRLIVETEYFLIEHYPLYGKYVVLLSIILLIVISIIYVQRKFSKKPLG